VAWSYDPAAFLDTTAGFYPPSTVGTRNQVRFWIQDTQSSRPLLQDAEVDWTLTTESNVYMAAAACCDLLVAKAGNVRTRKVGDLELTYDPEFYRQLADVLRARGAGHQLPYAGGISIADKMAQENDPDWVPPRLFRGEFDNPDAEQPRPGINTSTNTLTRTP
jgi:hypothetical protein